MNQIGETVSRGFYASPTQSPFDSRVPFKKLYGTFGIVASMSDTEPTTETPEADEPNRFRQIVFRRLVGLYIFFIIYVLSIGPMFWTWHTAFYVETDKLTSRMLVAFYEPLRYLCKLPYVGDVVDNYIEWWMFTA